MPRVHVYRVPRVHGYTGVPGYTYKGDSWGMRTGFAFGSKFGTTTTSLDTIHITTFLLSSGQKWRVQSAHVMHTLSEGGSETVCRNFLLRISEVFMLQVIFSTHTVILCAGVNCGRQSSQIHTVCCRPPAFRPNSAKLRKQGISPRCLEPNQFPLISRHPVS